MTGVPNTSIYIDELKTWRARFHESMFGYAILLVFIRLESNIVIQVSSLDNNITFYFYLLVKFCVGIHW